MKDVGGLIRGRLLARNALINFAGQGAPMLVALFAIPILISNLGTDRFGILALVWMVIGYFGLFDLGLGRALTQLVAQKLGADRRVEIPPLVWTALLLVLALGGIGALLLASFAPVVVGNVLMVPDPLRSETVKAFYLLALSLPFVISTAALRGVLEAEQRFGIINAVRIPMGVFTFLGPLLVLPFSTNLVPVVAVLLVGRTLAWVVHLWLCLRVVTGLRADIRIERRVVGPLVRFGGWITVSNIISPIMVYLDRFLIGGMLSVAAVAYYTTMYEVATKLWLVPSTLLGVLFPALATGFVHDRARAVLLFDRALRVLFLLVFPITILVVTLAWEGLVLWVGTEFALQSTRALQWLMLGIFINSMAQVPFAVIHSLGRADLTGKLHVVELPLYLAVVWWLTGALGIEGTAIAWTARIVVDTAVLFVVAKHLVPDGGRAIRRSAVMMTGATLLMFVPFALEGLLHRSIFLLLVLPLFGGTAWLLLLTPAERVMLRAYLGTLWSGRVVSADRAGTPSPQPGILTQESQPEFTLRRIAGETRPPSGV